MPAPTVASYSEPGYDLPGYSMEELDMGNCLDASQHKPPLDYYAWLERGKKLCAGHGNVSWKIGDWLLEGETEFDPQQFIESVPRHMLIGKADAEGNHHSVRIPNYWKDAAAETSMASQTLKEYAKVARAFPPNKRIKRLSFTHHKIAALAENQDKRFDYLAACLEGIGEGERPRSVAWLCDLILKDEGVQEFEPGGNHVRFPVSTEVWKKLKQLSKYKRMNVPELVCTVCTKAVESYLAEMAEKVALEKYGVYEGQWPFVDSVKTQRKETRRRKRADHKPAARAHGRAMAINRWNRNERVA